MFSERSTLFFVWVTHTSGENKIKFELNTIKRMLIMLDMATYKINVTCTKKYNTSTKHLYCANASLHEMSCQNTFNYFNYNLIEQVSKRYINKPVFDVICLSLSLHLTNLWNGLKYLLRAVTVVPLWPISLPLKLKG